jgi:spermidine/putrescine transport system permease protein
MASEVRQPSLSRFRLGALPLWLFAVITLLFLYLPIFVVILYSFTADELMTWPMPGLSLRWYQEFFSDRQLLQALRNSLTVAFWSTLIGLVIGIPAAIAIDRYTFPGKVVFQRLILLPFILPGILMGLALLTLFLNVGIGLSLGTVIAGHATLLVAVVIAETSVGLRRWDRTIEQAAMDLGANEWQTFFYVMLPNLRTVIGGAVLLGLTLSLDEITRTFFLTGTQNTYPLFIWSMMRQGLTPEINAAASLIFAASALVIIVWSRLMRE